MGNELARIHSGLNGIPQKTDVIGQFPWFGKGRFEMETKWITDISEIPAATEDSLKMSLLTVDGRGRALKTAALDELLKRKSMPLKELLARCNGVLVAHGYDENEGIRKDVEKALGYT